MAVAYGPFGSVRRLLGSGGSRLTFRLSGAEMAAAGCAEQRAIDAWPLLMWTGHVTAAKRTCRPTTVRFLRRLIF